MDEHVRACFIAQWDHKGELKLKNASKAPVCGRAVFPGHRQNAKILRNSLHFGPPGRDPPAELRALL